MLVEQNALLTGKLVKPEILARLAQGEFLAHLARELGVAKTTLQSRVKRTKQGRKAIQLGIEKRSYLAKQAMAKSVKQNLRALEKGAEVNVTSLTRAKQMDRLIEARGWA